MHENLREDSYEKYLCCKMWISRRKVGNLSGKSAGILPAELNNRKRLERGMETTIEEHIAAFPAIAALSKQLKKYREVNAEVLAIEARLAWAESDEEAALNKVAASEDEQFESISAARTRKDVTARRLSHKRLEVSRTLSALEEAYKPAEVEVSLAQSLELSRRQELLAQRVKGVLGLTSEDWEAEGFVFRAVGGSPFLTALRALAPNPNAHLVRGKIVFYCNE
jgi:hypothetical protein